ncbi:MAG: hypothetical protein GX039_07240, partial [Clostridia bacterium]|nr:hypothetical protein [Clostridia bacterium]
LNDLIPRSSLVVPVDSVRARGRDLFQIAKEQGLEGIVAKQMQSPYVPGEKTGYWFKIKAFRHLNAKIVGYRRGNGVSLLLAIEDENGFNNIGNAGTGLSYEQWQELLRELDKHKIASCPIKDCKAPADVTWVQPRIAVRVKYLEQKEDFKLRNPVIEQVLGK